MTKGFCTIINMPYEGAAITEHPTKADALKTYNSDATGVHLDNNGQPTLEGEFLGVALVHIDIIKQKGNWLQENKVQEMPRA